MPMESLAHQCLEFRDGVKTLKRRIAHEVGVAKESTLDAKTQHVQGGNPVTQNRISLSDFVYTLSVANAALFDLAFRLP
jgi:hypothetical protein